MKNNLPQSLQSDFSQIAVLIKTARSRALQKVNAELVMLYWTVGKRISEKIQKAEWGEGVVDKLAKYIKDAEPEIKGFTRRGLCFATHVNWKFS